MNGEQKEQVNQLNQRVCVRIAPSPIHGVGIFAIRDLPVGTKLFSDHVPAVYDLPYALFDKLNPNVAQILLERFPQIVYGSKFVFPTDRIQAYINHSYEANYDPALDLTIKEIKEGEEVTEDYRQIKGYSQVFPWLNGKEDVIL